MTEPDERSWAEVANTGRGSETRDHYQWVSGWYSFFACAFDSGPVLVSETVVGMVWSCR
ncbi:hypothetical protein ACH4F6_29220 [Streptomyces sp. NPDC017936]|uniref:hypothetical protein n=1 Tax=Streptomyces sp. NPDC017936 TaxID=3365016 RepID=UPI0037AD23C1